MNRFSKYLSGLLFPPLGFENFLQKKNVGIKYYVLPAGNDVSKAYPLKTIFAAAQAAATLKKTLKILLPPLFVYKVVSRK